MRFWRVLSSLVLLLGSLAFGQNCGIRIQDDANILGGSGLVSKAVFNLIDKGADPFVFTSNTFPGTGEQFVSGMHDRCTNWKSANGGVKNNLVVFLVFPKRHVVGLFTGAEFGFVNSTQIRTETMIPAFKDGDYTRGITNGIEQVGSQISAHRTGGSVINQQATDLKGLWVAMYITLGLIALLGLIVLISKISANRRKRLAAQQNAVNARNKAAQFVLQYPDSEGASEFARLNNSETYNPDTPDLSAEAYTNIALAYRGLVFKNKEDRKASVPTALGAPHGTPENIDTFPGYAGKQVSAPAPQTIVNNTYVDTYTPPVYVPPVIVEETYVEPSRGSGYSSSSFRSSDSSSSDSTGWSNSSSSSSYSDSSSSWSDSSSSSSFSDSGGDFSGGDSSW